jgi:hypothetical protein
MVFKIIPPAMRGKELFAVTGGTNSWEILNDKIQVEHFSVGGK